MTIATGRFAKLIFRTANLLVVIAACAFSISAFGSSAQEFKAWNKVFAAQRAKSQELLQRLRTQDKVIGVELIVAGPYFGSIGSQFGHAMLRFVTSAPYPDDDIVVGFVAQEDGPRLEISKGILGRYKVTTSIGTLASSLLNYAGAQARDVTRYVLPSTANERESLIQIVEGIFYENHSYGDYYFTHANCATLLERALVESGIMNPGPREIIPSALPKTLRKNATSPFPGIVMIPNSDIFENIVGQMGKTYDHEKLKRIIRTIPTRSLIQFLSLQGANMRIVARKEIATELRTRPDFSALQEDPFSMTAVPVSLYQKCSAGCLEQRRDIRSVSWNKETLAGQCKKTRLDNHYEITSRNKSARDPYLDLLCEKL